MLSNFNNGALRGFVAVSIVVGSLMAGSAAMAQATPESVVTGGLDELETSLLAIAGAVILTAVIFLAIRKGWSMVRRFVG